ncbi:MAG TPA: GNAT family N-acetyltransferase [Bacteroidetes bacterium]|nr:GNAT family N-acetyltransferase [Bacteroidota bacterium]HEX05134.1 GNAT family N-acetyltransferase [Bacteroidota bacterium]
MSRQDSTVLLKGILNSRELATPALLELRGGYQALPGIACVPSGYLHRTSLSADEAKVFARFDKQSVQRRIQKAQANRKLRVEYRTDAAAMREYYRLHIETRQRLGTVPAPRRYFEQLHTRLIEGARTGFIELVYYRGRLAAGSVLLTAYRTMSYKHSGSDKDLWKYHPNHLMLWNAMQTGCSMGLETFDFGRTGMGSINEGLRKFKMGWGSEEIQLQQIYAGTDPCLRAWTRRILRKAVFWLVPRTPRLVTQAAGELFYGHI